MVVIWSRFGPYHEARLRGADEVLGAQGAVVIGLEVASQDHYEWKPVVTERDSRRVTLFPGQDYSSLSSVRIVTAVSEALSHLEPRIVATNGWRAPEAMAAISWCTRNSRSCIVMSETKRDDVDGSRSRVKESLKSWILRRCGAALVGGRRQAEYLVRLDFPADRIFLGYDAVDNDYFARESASARSNIPGIRRNLGLPDRYFFCCTRFLARKNVDGLLRGYGKYRESYASEPWGLVISGSGEQVDELRVLESELRLAGVQWPGFVQYDELPKYYGLAGGFIHPAISEPWGLVVNEAAASGLPLLVGNTVGAAYELVRDGENGFLFDARDPESICRAMLQLSELPEAEREWMGQRSREIVSEWSPLRFGEGLSEAIRVASQAESLDSVCSGNLKD